MIQYIVKVLYSVRKLKVLKVFDDEDLINTQMGTRGRIRLSGGDVAKRNTHYIAASFRSFPC